MFDIDLYMKFDNLINILYIQNDPNIHYMNLYILHDTFITVSNVIILLLR